jgi:hypothetical protein
MDFVFPSVGVIVVSLWFVLLIEQWKLCYGSFVLYIDSVGCEELSKTFIFVSPRNTSHMPHDERVSIKFLFGAEVKCTVVGAGVRGNGQIDVEWTKNNYQIIE